MVFPSGFPDRAQSAVVAAQIRAIARMENELAYHMLNPGPEAELLGRLGRGYLMEILAVFAKEACELGHAGTWTARHIDIEVMAFMRQLAADFRSEYSHIGMPAMLDNWSAIDPAVLRELKLSDKWKAYQAELLQIAELQSANPSITDHNEVNAPLDSPKPSTGTTVHTKRTRHSREPNPEILSGKDFVSRKQAAEALGVATRTIDRYVEDNKLHPSGEWGHKRFKTQELRHFMNRKKKRRVRQKKTK